MSSIYEKKTRRSRELFDRAVQVIPGGAAYRIRSFDPYPFYVDRAAGAKLYDVDGNEYTDYWCTHFSMILGHAHAQVIDAMRKQIERGYHFGTVHRLEVELAEKISRFVPCAESVRFITSGTEANMYAVRLARTYTGRTKIVKFAGGWHGGYDGLHVAVKPPFEQPQSGGITENAAKDTLVLPYNNLQEVNATASKDIACYLIEPVLGAGGMIPAKKDFLQGLRKICNETGSLLIFDEIITGLRLGLGGGQVFFGVKPDLATMGKIAGGGMPMGAIVGLQEIMMKTDYKRYSGRDLAFVGGTGISNVLSLTCGNATIEFLEQNPVYSKINRLGESLRENLNNVFRDAKTDFAVTGIGSLFGIHAGCKEPPVRPLNTTISSRSRVLHQKLLDKNIFVVSPEMIHAAISYAHSEDDIEALSRALAEAISEI